MRFRLRIRLACSDALLNDVSEGRRKAVKVGGKRSSEDKPSSSNASGKSSSSSPSVGYLNVLLSLEPVSAIFACMCVCG